MSKQLAMAVQTILIKWQLRIRRVYDVERWQIRRYERKVPADSCLATPRCTACCNNHYNNNYQSSNNSNIMNLSCQFY